MCKLKRIILYCVLGGGLWTCEGEGGDASSTDFRQEMMPFEGDEAGECNDGADNDQDGDFDCNDEGCQGSPICMSGDDGGTAGAGGGAGNGGEGGSSGNGGEGGSSGNGGEGGGCVPNCLGRACGDDSCGGECDPGCVDGEACSAEGACVSASCGGEVLNIEGGLQTDAALVIFDSASVNVMHKRDIDEGEDGCIVEVEITLTSGEGCVLSIRAADYLTERGGLNVDSFSFRADSFCPNFPDPTEGTYEGNGLELAEIALGVTEVPEYNVAESCVATTFTLNLQGNLNRVGDGLPLAVNLSGIQLSGEFISVGSPNRSCPNRCGDGEVNGDEECDGGEGCNEECILALPELDWVRIEGGVFSMGSNNGFDHEQPVHQVTVPTFEIMRTELTVAQYRTCVNAGVCSVPGCDNGDAHCNYSHEREDHPVNYVSWIQMNEFAAWAGVRLPSEAEWEYTARAQGQNITYPWGNAAPDCSYADYHNHNNDAYCNGEGTSPVCNTPLGNTTQGLCDMAGNLWEWVLDEYHSDYNGAPIDGSPWCETLACANNGAYRVIRGGGWSGSARYLRAAYRFYHSPTDQAAYIGGRLARPVR